MSRHPKAESLQLCAPSRVTLIGRVLVPADLEHAFRKDSAGLGPTADTIIPRIHAPVVFLGFRAHDWPRSNRCRAAAPLATCSGMPTFRQDR